MQMDAAHAGLTSSGTQHIASREASGKYVWDPYAYRLFLSNPSPRARFID